MSIATKHNADEYDEPRRKRYIRCSDRMCGADDCQNCHPENFQGGVYVGDIEAAQQDKVVLQRLVNPILVFPNLNIACFNAAGEQIPELQKSIPTLIAEHAEQCGYDLDGAIISTHDGNWRMFRTEDGGWNRELVKR